MLVLGLESSCDETAAAVVEAAPGVAPRARSNVVASQVSVHARWGGVVPEIAARHHLQNLLPVITDALSEAAITLDDLDAIAVTQGPGLIGALLVAVQAAKAISFARGLPLIGVHHHEGHLLAAYLDSRQDAAAPPHRSPPLPHLALLVSGGHTSLIHVEDIGRYEVLGSTRDDAAGEAFDKVGKLLGLGYPAGPVIDRLSMGGDPGAVRFPRAMLGGKRGLGFSFSGLKTAAAEHLRRHGVPADAATMASLCASFQAAVVEQLVRKSALALNAYKLPALVLAGGVACNSGLRAAMASLCAARDIDFFVAPPRYCTDNAAMIACAGWFRLQRGERADLSLSARADLTLS